MGLREYEETLKIMFSLSIGDMEEDGSFRTNPLQREELSSRESNLLGNLKDMWFQALGGR